MNQQQIDDLLSTGPTEDGEIVTQSGVTVPYRLRLLSPGAVNELKIERNRYLASRGIDECTPATAEIYDAELQFRVCTEAVRKRDSDEPLTSLEGWRKHIGPAVRTCLDHYTKLEATSSTIDPELARNLPMLTSYVRQEQGPGHGAYWQTVDYETLLACFAALSLTHDQTIAELDEAERKLAQAKRQRKRK